MHRSLIVFAVAAPIFLLISGCTSGGGLDPNIGKALSSVPGGIMNSQSKEMQFLGGAAKLWDATNMSDADAKQIGEPTAVAIINQPEYRLSTDDGLNGYVTKVGLTVASVSARTDIDYTFGVLESTTPNAFSMPGGFIFVTRGALMRMQDESELAGVLAHEVGHICKGHAKESLKRMKQFEGLAQMGTADQRLAQFKEIISNFSKEVVSKVNSTEDENAADSEAIKYVKLAGYDPMGLSRYLSRVNTGSASGFFRTHPVTADRVKKIEGYAGGASGAKLKERFVANVK